MKQIARTAGGGGRRIPTEDDVEVAEILIDLPKLSFKSEFIGGCSFNWGRKKKRSVLDLKSKLSPSPETQPPASEADKTPSTPLVFFTGGSGSDGGCNRKPPSSVNKPLKRKATDDVMDVEIELLMKKVKAMETLHQELCSQNTELKARGQKIRYSRNIKDFHKWSSFMKSIDHHQITMFAPTTPQQVQPQLVVDPEPVCSSNSNGGVRFGLFNGEIYDIMASSQPLDQSNSWVMDNDPRVRAAAAAAARKKRILRMKENKIHVEIYDISQPLDQSISRVMDNDPRVRAAAARKKRILRMKENKIHGEIYDIMASSQPLDQSKYWVMYNDLRVRAEAATARNKRILRMKEKAMKLSKACR